MKSTEQERAGRYTKKPVTIEAVQYGRRFDWPHWFHNAVSADKVFVYGTGKHADPREECFALIHTLEGVMRVSDGDWIIRGVKGELHPCKPDVFAATYEPEQAARRAPVVPHGWKLAPEESTEAMARAFRADDAPYYFAMTTIRCNDFAERYRAALAAAPQPPEAEQCQSCRAGSPYACTCTFKTNRNSAPSCFEAEPVQLTELLRKLRISAKRDGELGRDSVRTDEIEQQVRQLLADYGIEVI